VRRALPLATCLLASACSRTPDLAYEAPTGADGGRTDTDGGVAEAGNADGVDAPGSSARKKALTIDHAKVPGALADFPVWVDVADPQIGARAQADGHDLFFTASDGTPLAHEIRGWNQSHLTAWVRVPQVSDTASTVIYLRYGDPTGAPAPAPAAVFSSSFAAVWHLDDSLASAAIADATGAHAGTGVGLAPAQQVAAQLGGGVSFTGGNDEITFTNPLSGNGPHTISVWVSQRTTADNDALVVLGNGACGQSRWLHSRYNASTIAAGFYCNDWTNPNVDVENGGWTLLHWVFENDTSLLYKNGALAAGPFTQTGTAIDTQGTGGHLGNAPAAWGPNMGAHATMDEVRLATVARAPAWIAAEYANQSSPSTFYAVGPEEPAP
jgi:hypothetical protein